MGKEDSRTKVVLADDHRVVRSGLRMLLEAAEDIEVVAEADDADWAARYCRGHKPQVAVLDLNMPGKSTLEAIPEIRRDSPGTEVVILTMQDDPAFAREALKSGARGFVLKAAADDELVEAVRLAARGEAYLNPQLGARLAVEPPPGPPEGLSDEEAQLVRLVALGYTNNEIGERLHLSGRTVENHRAQIQRKLGLATRAELVRYALDEGLLA